MANEEIENIKQQLKLQGSFFAEKAIEAINHLQSKVNDLEAEFFENKIELLIQRYDALIAKISLNILKEEKLNAEIHNTANYQLN